MKPIFLIAAIFSVILLLGCPQPSDCGNGVCEPYESLESCPEDCEQDALEFEKAEWINSLLVAQGLEESLVKIKGSEIIVRYNQPELYSEIDPITHFGIILGTVSGIAPELETIKIQAFVAEEPFSEVIVSMDNLLAYQNNEMDFESFAKTWEINAITK
ncbi:MAG: hypothetical protein JW772_04005 [Candidatus Diapherotrites archaeon]|nr:hypothetical protein [Candidatus Diapherotrites archaeon]